MTDPGPCIGETDKGKVDSDLVKRLRDAEERLPSIYGNQEMRRLIEEVCQTLSVPRQEGRPAAQTLCWARPLGATMDSMRNHVWETGLADKGDTILIWVNEGDFWQLAMSGVGLKEYKNPEPLPPVPGPNIKAEAIDRNVAVSPHSQEVAAR